MYEIAKRLDKGMVQFSLQYPNLERAAFDAQRLSERIGVVSTAVFDDDDRLLVEYRKGFTVRTAG